MTYKTTIEKAGYEFVYDSGLIQTYRKTNKHNALELSISLDILFLDVINKDGSKITVINRMHFSNDDELNYLITKNHYYHDSSIG